MRDIQTSGNGAASGNRTRALLPPEAPPSGEQRRNMWRLNPDGTHVICEIEGCALPVHARGFCQRHYAQRWRYASIWQPSARQCSVPECTRRHEALGYCSMHYSRFYRYGDPLAVRRVTKYRELPTEITSAAELGRVLGVSRQRAHQLLNPLKNKARAIVQNAIEQGIIARPPFCFRCGKETTDLEAHHWDYARPLDVGWFCVPCHNIVHPHGRAKTVTPPAESAASRLALGASITNGQRR